MFLKRDQDSNASVMQCAPFTPTSPFFDNGIPLPLKRVILDGSVGGALREVVVHAPPGATWLL